MYDSIKEQHQFKRTSGKKGFQLLEILPEIFDNDSLIFTFT